MATFLKQAAVAAAVWCLGLAPVQPAGATEQEAAFLRHVAEQYMLAQFPTERDGVRIQVKAGVIDTRKDYGGKCPGYLTAQLQGSRITENSKVKIVCKDQKHPYSVVVPVTVKRQRLTMVAAENLPRGTVLSEQMLEEVWLDENAITPGTVNERLAVVGSRLKKDLKAGDTLRNGMFCLVCKGDTVSLEANNGKLSLKTTAEAVEDGNLADNIRVKNLKSKKIISARVTGAGTVSVQF
ncbi:MAG: flagellar basal body P-ring formation protein FlgA [Succinivibrio sp.]|nr:flagellar basal body P-ring formation protein FlgA [Succinivibrio sp.]